MLTCLWELRNYFGYQARIPSALRGAMNDVSYMNCKLHDLSVDEEKGFWFQTTLVWKGTWRIEVKGEEWETEVGKGSSG